MYKLLFFCFAVLALSSPVYAAIIKNGPPTVKETSNMIKKVYHVQVDSSKITLHKLSSDSLNKYRGLPEFTYREKSKAGQSWWTRFWNWFWELMAKLFGRSQQPASRSPYGSYVVAFVILALLIYVIFKLAGLNPAGIFSRKSKDLTIPYSESLENIHQITFDDEIEKALNQRNYRLAVRLLYLRTLKQLNDAQLINWQLEKTNTEYLNELTNADQRQSFGILTRQFEYVWYGDFPVDSRSFQNINTLFHDFKTLVK